mgnify:CR=1 FL=1
MLAEGDKGRAAAHLQPGNHFVYPEEFENNNLLHHYPPIQAPEFFVSNVQHVDARAQ